LLTRLEGVLENANFKAQTN